MRTGRGGTANGPRGLTRPERRLWAAVRGGVQLDLTGRPDEDRTIRAEVVRNLLTAGIGPDGEQRLRLRGARITGSLEMLAVSSGTALVLMDCVLTAPLALTGSELPELALIDCRAPSLALGWLTTAGSVRLVGNEVPGPVYLT